MFPLVCALLLAGIASARAHYRGYETRNLIERDEPVKRYDGLEVVECPVCDPGRAPYWQSYSEDCNIRIDGKTYKTCPYGTYKNEKCGNRRDCYRGEDEPCTEKYIIDLYGVRCAPTLYCDATLNRCTGTDKAMDANIRRYINRFRSASSSETGRLSPATADINKLIRERRLASIDQRV